MSEFHLTSEQQAKLEEIHKFAQGTEKKLHELDKLSKAIAQKWKQRKASQSSSDGDEEKIHRVLEYYENQSEDEAVVEDENLLEVPTHTLMNIPLELVPIVRDLIAKYESSI